MNKEYQFIPCRFVPYIFGRGEPTILRTRCEQSVDDDL